MPTTVETKPLRIMLCSHWFHPSIGGVETVSMLLAEEFTKAGHEVSVVTTTAGSETYSGFRVLRQPSSKQIYDLAKASDIVFQNTISLRTLAAIVPSGTPVVVTHQSWMRRGDGSLGLENRLKRVAVRACRNVAISVAIADSLPVPSVVIGNPFEQQEFEALRDRPRDKDIVFMGRMIGDKGCDVLLEALAHLRKKGLTPSVTIVGDGPEMPNLRKMSTDLGLDGQIEFLGALRAGRGEVVARHRIMAIPSRWAEPFGIVALEGIASGCAIVASAKGGLRDAAGPCGLYFPNGDAVALAAELETLLTNPVLLAELIAKGPEHVKNFQASVISARYLALFRDVIAGRKVTTLP